MLPMQTLRGMRLCDDIKRREREREEMMEMVMMAMILVMKM